MANIKIRDVMTPMAIWIDEDDTIQMASKKMADCDIGALPIINKEWELVGILTDRDIIIRGCANNLDLDTSVKEIMTSDVRFCSPDDNVSDVANTMASLKVRRMPVIEGNRLVGFCSLANLAMSLKNDPQIIENMLSKISSPGTPRCEAA